MSTARSRTPSRKRVIAAGRDHLAVGVTGGIGSGKSALCGAFAGLGRLVISADLLARDLTNNDAGIIQDIRAGFGDTVMTAAGAVDRKALAAVVFHDPEARERLNAIVHPRVFTALSEKLAAEPAGRLRPYVVIEAALIYEAGMELDYVIVVDAPEEERIRRVMLRDGCSREEVLSRIASQMSATEKRKRADFIVENTGQADALAHQAAFLDTLLTALPQRIKESA